MPEFPEVFTIVSDLAHEFTGSKIVSVTVLDAKLVRPNPNIFDKIINIPITHIGQKGKTIVFAFKNEMMMTFHLRMTGRLLLVDKDFITNSYTKIVFIINNKKLLFTEVRKFGYCEVLTKIEFESKYKHLAPNIMDITKEEFAQRVLSKNTIIKRAILDQTVLAGIGNIYASEGLWLAKINPEKKTRDLSIVELNTLLKSLVTVVNKGIKQRGSTLGDKSFVDLYGKHGTAQDFLQVYDRFSKPCSRCKTPIVVKKIAQRSSYFCPICQCT